MMAKAEAKADTARIGRNVERMISLKAPEDDIDAYLKTEGFTPESFRAAMIERRVDPAAEVGAIGAAAGRVLYGALGAPVDVVNAGLNLVGMGSANPVGGSQWIQDRAGNVVDIAMLRAPGAPGPSGAEIVAAEPQTAGGRIAGRALGEVAAAALPMAALAGRTAQAARSGLQEAPTLGKALRDSFGGTSTRDRAANLVTSAGAGVGAGAANEMAPGSVWADFAGGLLGGGLTAGGLGAGGFLTDAIAPMVSPAARRDIAAQTIRRFASDPNSVIGAPSEVLPGSPLTTAAAARDSGLAQLERTLRQQPDSAKDFVARDTERAAAQRGAVDALAPQGPGAESVADMVRARRDQFQRRADVRETLGQNAVEQGLRQLGPGLGPVEAGGTVRREIGNSTVEVGDETVPYGARAVAKAGEKTLWNRLDQNEDLALEAGAGRQAAETIVGRMTPSTQPLSGDAAGVIEAARNLGDVVRWRELQDLRSWALSTGERLSREGDAVNAGRMNTVVAGLDRDIARAAGDDAPGPGAGPAPAAPPRPSAGPGGLSREQMLRQSEEAGAIAGLEQRIADGKDLSLSIDGASVRAGYGLAEETFITLDLTTAERRALTKANAEWELADTVEQRQQARQAVQQILLPATQRAIAKNRAGRTTGGSGPAGTSAVFTPDGMKVETEWRLVDLAGPDAPIMSHTPDFRPNPDYPQSLQPRNRDRAASEAQVVRMAGELNPERLGAGGVGDGAPIIGPDRVTESGNGRLMAIDRAYSNGGRRATEYRAWIEQQGFPTDGMQRPALVRVRTNALSDGDRVRWTEGANAGPGLKLSPAEQAAVDARRVGDDTLSLYQGGALDDAANTDFARAFVRQAAPGDAGTLSTADGRLSLEGVRRMQAAMLHRAYGDAPLVQMLLETGDDNIKALGRAFADTAPLVAQLRAAIARGEVPADFDPLATVTDAARVVQRARKDGVPIGDVLAQADAFNPVNPHAALLLGAAYGDGLRRVSYGRAVEALRTYADEAMRQTGGGDMFGPGPQAGDVWQAAVRRARGVADDTAAEAAPGGAGGAVPPAGGGAGAAGGGAGGGGGSSVVGDGLTPNFGPDDRAAYRAAREATRERAETFDRGSVGQVLQKGGYRARGEEGYLLPVEQVAGKFFNAGRNSATDIAEFVRAAEGRPAAVQALRDYAVGDLRRSAVDDAGRVDPKRWAAWVGKHGQALTAFPDLRREFSSVQAAQRSLDRVTGRRQAAMAGLEKSAAGQFLGGKDADQAFASVIRSGKRTEGLRQLVRMAKGDEDKLGQVRRAAVDHLLKSIENTGAVDAAGNQQLSAAKAIRFMGDNAKPLQKSGLMTPSQIAVLRRVEEDLRRGTYVATVGKIPGSPTYQNFSSAALLGRLALDIEGKGSGAVGGFLSGVLGNTAGRAASFLYRIPDRQIGELIKDAMLDPRLARDLMARATPERLETVWSAIGRRAVRAGLVSGATASVAAE